MWKFTLAVCVLLYSTVCMTQSQTSIHLRLGNFSNTGVLQKYNSQPGGITWLDICPGNENISIHGTIVPVLCRSTGHNFGIAASRRTRTSRTEPSVRLYGLTCTGSEAHISECSFTEQVNTICSQEYVITCDQCTDSQVRLRNGVITHQGFAEVCVNSTWKRPCPSNWGYSNSYLVCRQLSYPTTNVVYSSYRLDVEDIYTEFELYPYQVDCFGNESSLQSCEFTLNPSCQAAFEAGYIPFITVWCQGELTVPSCSHGDVRLIGGKDMYEGVVQICRDNLWGTFSSYLWDSLDARVVCRQLGLLQVNGSATRITRLDIIGDVGTGPIYDSPLCSGNESRLIDCAEHSGVTFMTRTHQYDAAVRCQTVNSEACNNRGARLVGSASSNEGRIELCYEGVWGSICSFSVGTRFAAVLCRQLGFSGTNNTLVYQYDSYLPFGKGNSPIHFGDFSCSGYESNVINCASGQIGRHTCTSPYDFDLGIICDAQPATQCTNGDIRLTAGFSETDGVLQLCSQGQWYSSCSNNWNVRASDAACRRILQQNDVASTYSTCCSREREFARGNISVTFNCGSANIVNFPQDCTHQLTATTCSPVVIGCYARVSCTENSLRLFNGTSANNGVVQVCRQGVWGNINIFFWNVNVSMVVCRQLGLPTEWSHGTRYFPHSDLTEIGAPMFYTGMQCQGHESSILGCTYTSYSLPNVGVRSDSPLVVICQNNQTTGGHPPCNSGDVRLGNMTNSGNRIEGRVEVCTEGIWVSFCSYGTFNSSSIICRQVLGRPATASYYIQGKDYGPTNLSALYQIVCPRDSATINECTIYHQPVNRQYGSCSHRFRLGVVCETGVYHEVQITPSQTPPYAIGQSVTFNCGISPQPLSPVYYSWRIGTSGYIFLLSQNLTIIIASDYYESVLVSCNVYINSFNVEGVAEFTVKGYLESIMPSVPLNMLVGLTSTLEVAKSNSTFSSFAARYNLNWFFNGQLISNTSDSLITNGNSSLTTTIREGIYEARYEGISVIPEDTLCKSNLLRFLRKYPFMKPARFVVNANAYDEEATVILQALSTTSRTITASNGDSLLFHFEGQIPVGLEPSDVDIKLYHGTTLLHVLNYTKSLDGTISGSYAISHSIFSDHGRYEAQLRWLYRRPCNHYFTQFLQITPHFDSYHGGFEEIILASSRLNVIYTDSLVHVFSSNATIILAGESAALSCHASAIYPHISSIAIVKNHITLVSSSQSSVTYNTNTIQNKFGRYECLLNTSRGPIWKALTIKERAAAVLNIQFSNTVSCNDGFIFTELVKNSIIFYLKRECGCDLTNDIIYDIEIDCRSGYRAYSEVTIDYSSNDGNISASALARVLTGQTTASDLRFDFAGGSAHIVSVCDEPICTDIPPDPGLSTSSPRVSTLPGPLMNPTTEPSSPPTTETPPSTLPPTTETPPSTLPPTTTPPTNTEQQTTSEFTTEFISTNSDTSTSGSFSSGTVATPFSVTCPDGTVILGTTSAQTTSAVSTPPTTSISSNGATSSSHSESITPVELITPESATTSPDVTPDSTPDTTSAATITGEGETTSLNEDIETTESTSSESDTSSTPTTQNGNLESSAQLEQLLPTPYLIGAFVGVFVGGALASAMVTSCIFLTYIRSKSNRAVKNFKKMKMSEYKDNSIMKFSDFENKDNVRTHI